jgi:nucleoid-associated protein YgaU
MGLISFVKSAGEKLFGASEAKAATPDALQKELEKHGLDTSGVKIAVDGDKVHVTGSAPTTEQAEKIAVALGNTVGVQTVQNDIKPATAAPESKFYTVKSGDTLWAISEKEYGKGRRREVRDHLPGQPADADSPRQDLSRSGVTHPAHEVS